MAWGVAGALVVTAALAGVIWMSANPAPTSVPRVRSAAIARRSTAPAALVNATSSPLATAASRIEVPDLSHMTLPQAKTVLDAAGLKMKVTREGTVTADAQVLVIRQTPVAGTVATSGVTVTLVAPALRPRPPAKKAAKRAGSGLVVVIDPGHQSHANPVQEPIGPGSTETKAKMTAGATGVTSDVPEYELDLEIATNLARRLESAGVKVVMTRTTNDVDLSNAERAQIANQASADLFVRIHADSSTNPATTGVSTEYPAPNSWTASFAKPSHTAADLIRQRLVAATGAHDGGSMQHADIAGFNWSKVPCVLVQTGFQSNAVEDKLLTSSHYQDLVAQGIADGVAAYLKSGR